MKLFARRKSPLTATPSVLCLGAKFARDAASPVAEVPARHVTNGEQIAGLGPRAALPVSHTIVLCDGDRGRTLFRVPEWTRPPEIIEWRGRRFVKYANNQYREAVTFSLYVGYNAESIQEGVAQLNLRR